MATITFDDFKKIKIQIGTLLDVEKVEGSNKLLKLTVDFGEESPRTILSGISKYFNIEDLKGKQLPFITNMEPKKMLGMESKGMLLAADIEGRPILLIPQEEVTPGTRVI